MLTKSQKEKIVDDLAKKFAEEKIVIFSKIHKIPLQRLDDLRRKLKKIGAELKIAKKTLMKRAVEIAGLALDPKKLEGEVGIIFGYENQVETAKIIQKFKKENDTLQILAGLLDKKIISGADVVALAKLPSREQLLAMLAGTLVAPIRNLLNVFQGNQRKLVVVLTKIKDKK
ncbi:MAG: 50S ribosomal protein L10 [Candidatus Sungbacteria bacterium]|nr:50S ribosomal protein L10 [Candidatus Sungbacteria bacterium]